MAAGAIITDAFKKKILLELDSDISNRAEYYIHLEREDLVPLFEHFTNAKR